MDHSTEENRKRLETSRVRGRSDVAAAAGRDEIPTRVQTRIPEMLERYDQAVLKDWLPAQMSSLAARKDLISEVELTKQSADFLAVFTAACRIGSLTDINAANWQPVLKFLGTVSRSRALGGFSASETATFVFSLKQPLFMRLRQEFSKDPEVLADELWNTTVLLDKLGLYTTEVFQKSREEIINRQQLDMLELSTPVVKLWNGILAIPLIGTLDSSRTQVVMESLLKGLAETGSTIAILDITGVPTVDTIVAQNLLKTAMAAKLMGAHCIICGIRPQIAQTMVHLGVEFGEVATKATLADALLFAFQLLQIKVAAPTLFSQAKEA
jgi:rsbT co-antagonist protein RsbR